MDTRYLTAIELTETVQPGSNDVAREGMLVGMAPEHAFVGDRTLCGLPR